MLKKHFCDNHMSNSSIYENVIFLPIILQQKRLHTWTEIRSTPLSLNLYRNMYEIDRASDT